MSEMQKNGKQTHINESGAIYDGHTLDIYQHKNGVSKFKQLTNQEIQNMVFKIPEHNKHSLASRLTVDFPKRKSRRRRSHHKRSHHKRSQHKRSQHKRSHHKRTRSQRIRNRRQTPHHRRTKRK